MRAGDGLGPTKTSGRGRGLSGLRGSSADTTMLGRSARTKAIHRSASPLGAGGNSEAGRPSALARARNR